MTTIDWRLQKIVEKNLRAQLLSSWGKGARRSALAGAVVVIDPSNGGVLALASMPEFDPNEFATPIDEKKYAALLNDKLNPLYDRAIGAASPSGSTFKMVTGTGAITSGVIKPHQVLYDSGAWIVPRQHVLTTSRRAASATSASCARSPRRPTAISTSSAGGWGHERLRYCATQYGLGSQARHRSARRVSRQLADRRVDAGARSAKAIISSRATCASSRSDKARCRRRRCRWPASPRPSSTAARCTGRTSSSEIRSPRGKRAQDVRSRDHPATSPSRAEALREVHDGMSQGHRAVGHRLRPRDRRPAVLRQDRHRRDRRRPRPEHDVVRRLGAGDSSEDRDGRLHGEVRRLRLPASPRRSRSTSSPSTSARRSRRSDARCALDAREDREHAPDLVRARVGAPGEIGVDQVVALRAMQAVRGRERDGSVGVAQRAFEQRDVAAPRRAVDGGVALGDDVRRVRALERRRDDVAVALAERLRSRRRAARLLLRRTLSRGCRRTTRRRRCRGRRSRGGVRVSSSSPASGSTSAGHEIARAKTRDGSRHAHASRAPPCGAERHRLDRRDAR